MYLPYESANKAQNDWGQACHFGGRVFVWFGKYLLQSSAHLQMIYSLQIETL